MEKNQEAFVYIWCNLSLNKFYIGYHKGSFDDKYICSSHSDKFWKDFNNINFCWERYIIYFGTCNQCLNLEQFILSQLNLRDDAIYNNGKGAKIIFTNEVKQKMSVSHKKRWKIMSDEKRAQHAQKISKSKKGIKRPKEMGEHLSKLFKGISMIERYGEEKAKEIIEKVSNSNKGKKRTEEFKQQQREKLLGNTFGANISEEVRQAKRERMLGEKNPNFGKPISEETKAKMSKSKTGIPSKYKGISRKQIVCPHCSKSGGVGVMNRWHFDNCKLKNEE